MGHRNPNRGTTKHHLLFPAAEWMLRPESAYLRQRPSLIPRMRNEDHAYLHTQVPVVPALGYNTLRAVVQLWTPEEDTIADIDGLCRALDQAASHEKSHPIESDLAGLCIDALILQREIILEVGLPKSDLMLRR